MNRRAMKKALLSFGMLGVTIILKAQNPYPVLPIDTIQFVNQAKLDSAAANTLPDYISPVFKNTTYGDTIRFEGVVISSPKIYGLSSSRRGAFIQRVGGGAWSGAFVMCEPIGTGTTLANLLSETKFYDNFLTGYKVKVTGVIKDFQGETQINLIRNNANWDNSVERVSFTPDALVYTPINISELMTGNPNTTWAQQKSTAEKYEGTLVSISNVSVYSIQQSGNRSFWSVIDDSGNVIDIRDVSAHYRRDDNEDTIPKIANTFQPPPIGTRLQYIRGVVTEFLSSNITRYGIIPIYPSDLGYFPPKFISATQMPSIVTITDSVEINASVVADTILTSVVLRYNTDGGNVFTEVAMQNTGGDCWMAKIPPFAANTVVKYYTRATDTRNLRTDFPDTLATNSNYLVTDSGITNIAILQYSASSSGATIWDGDSLTGMSVEGVITGNNFNAGTTHLLTIQEGLGPNSAIFIQRSATNDITEKWNIGDRVKITSGVVREIFNITTLNEIRGDVLSRGNALPAFMDTLQITPFASNNIEYSRKWEGVLVKWDSVYVTRIIPDGAGDNGEWAFHTDTTRIGLRVDDMSISLLNINNTIHRGQFILNLQGPMFYSGSNFKVIPRSLSDIEMCSLDTGAPILNLLGDSPDTLVVGSIYIDVGATASDVRDGNLNNNITVSGVVNADTVGTYIQTYNVSDFCGNAATLTRTVFVIDTSNVGVKENELNAASLSLYPNPTKGSITIDAKFIQTQPVTVTVLDILGRELDKRVYTDSEFMDVINTSSYNSGVYFCTIRNASGSKTLKFMVSGK